MTFPINNLPTESRFWGREVEKKITNLESTLASSEINNTTRDSQLTVTANQALIAATDAATAATAANNAINGLVSLSSDGSTYEIHGGNLKFGTVTADTVVSTYVYGGTINANQINAGTVTGLNISGGTLSTTGTRRVEISGTSAKFFDDGGIQNGSITASGSGSSSALFMGTGNGNITIGNGTFDLNSNGTVAVTGGNGFSTTSINNSGTYTGNGFPTIGANTVSGTSFPANTFVASGGNMARKTDASERRLKENINNFEFDTDAFINVNPVTFNYKRDAVSSDEQAEAVNVGFILDDFEAAGLSQFLVYQAEGDDFKQLRYDLLSIYLHKVVQTQHETIKALEARIEALETK